MMDLDNDFIELMKTSAEMHGSDDLSSTIFALLFIEPEPLSMEELSKRTGYSIASISNKVKTLERMGCIQKKNKPGSKKFFLTASKDYLSLLKDHLLKMKEAKIGLIKRALPSIITKYKPKSKSELEKQKIKILENYHKQLSQFESVVDKMIRYIENG